MDSPPQKQNQMSDTLVRIYQSNKARDITHQELNYSSIDFNSHFKNRIKQSSSTQN